MLYPLLAVVVLVMGGGHVPTCSSFLTLRTFIRPNASSRIEISTAAVSFKHVQAVIFDVDGTLADSGQLGFDATLVVLERNGIPPITYDEYCDHTRYTTPDRLARHAGLTPEDTKPDRFQSEGQRLGKEFDDLYINLVSMETASFYPGMLEIVQNIPEESVDLGALTNAAGRYAHAVLTVNNEECGAAFDLYKRFGSILGADDVPKPKPYADGLLQVCKELNVDPKQCVYIGDSPSDGQAARAAGMPGIGVIWGAHGEAKLAPFFSHICRSVDELASLLPQKIKCT